jgi:hypothetical protein
MKKSDYLWERTPLACGSRRLAANDCSTGPVSLARQRRALL